MVDPAGRFTILVVDDSEDILELLEVTLRKHYNVKRATDGRSALRVAFEKPRPDLILLDVEMPGSNGYNVCRAIKASPALADVPVIFLTQRSDTEDVVQGFQLGAIDYFAKPINPPVLAARIRAHVELITRRGQQEELIRVRTTQLEHTRLQLIRRLARAMEYHETSAVGNRVVRLGHYARHLAEAAGAKPVLCDLVMKAAPLHDIGKLGVPAQILRKTEMLTAPEREQMQRHPEIGAEIIGEHDDPLLKLARTLALTHHERWDGTGYPARLRGDAIPWPGRVMAVVDAFEGMTATQFHHQPMPLDLAADEIARGSGKQFDPQMVEAFRKALPAFRRVRETYADALGDMLDLDFVATPPPAPVEEAQASMATGAAQREAAEASALQAMLVSDEARAGVLALAQARLKVERDLIAAATKDVSTQQAARKRAEEAGAREAEAIGLSRRRVAEEAAAAHVAQERAKAEGNAAKAALQAERAKAQALAETEARVAAEQALAAAAAERKNAEEALAKTAADLAARETEALELARRRSAGEADATRAALERAKAEQDAAKLAQQTAQANEQLLAEADARARAEQSLAAAAGEKRKAEEAAANAAAATALSAQRQAAAARQRAEDEAAAKAETEKRFAAEAQFERAVKETDSANARALADGKAIADMHAGLKVERDLIAAAAGKVAAERSATALADDRAARESEALETARRRVVEESAATRAAQERATAEEDLAKLAQQTAHARQQMLAEADARANAEQALAAAAGEKRKAEEAAARAAEAIATAGQRMAAAAKQRAADQAGAKAAAEKRIEAEADGARAVKEADMSNAQALADGKAIAEIQSRIAIERDLAAAAQYKLAEERAELGLAQERVKADGEKLMEAQQALQAREQALAQAELRAAAENTRAAAQAKMRLEEASGGREAERVPAVEAPQPVHRGKLRTVLYAAVLMAALAAAAVFYIELQMRPAQPATQSVPPPAAIPVSEPRPVPGISQGAPLELRLDIDAEKLAPRERAN